MFLESSDQTCTYIYMLKLIPGYLPTRQSLYTLYLVFPRAKTFKFLQNYQLSYSFPWSIFPLHILHVLCMILQYVKDKFTQLKNAFHGLNNSDNQVVLGPAVHLACWQLSTNSTRCRLEIYFGI
jgi:hypothetical protein